MSITTQSNQNHSIKVAASLTLQTKIGQSLFNGTWRAGKLGIRQFAKMTLVLWEAVKQDDPYAEWYLLKVYRAIHEAREAIKQIDATLHEQLHDRHGVKVEDVFTHSANTYPLNFATPFAYMASFLVADIDRAICQVLLMQKFGIPILDDAISLKKLVAFAQDTFAIPKKWHAIGVTRGDVLISNEKATRAASLMGQLPDAVLNQQIDFLFLPK